MYDVPTLCMGLMERGGEGEGRSQSEGWMDGGREGGRESHLYTQCTYM